MFCRFLFVHMQKLFLAKLRVKITTHTRAGKNLNSRLSFRQAALTWFEGHKFISLGLLILALPLLHKGIIYLFIYVACQEPLGQQENLLVWTTRRDFCALLTPSCIPLQQLSVGLHSLDHHNIPLGGDWERVYSQYYVLCTSWLESHNEEYTVLGYSLHNYIHGFGAELP